MGQPSAVMRYHFFFIMIHIDVDDDENLLRMTMLPMKKTFDDL